MEILFLHGAGGWVDDQPMAGQLQTLSGQPVTMPRFPDEDMSAAAWRGELSRQLQARGAEPVIVGHSFGASMALLHYADNDPQGPRPLGLVLLATPFWGSEGWQAEYSLPAAAQLPADLPLFLHHCADDDVVPVDHLDRHADRLPHALIRRHERGGHQFQGRMAAVAEDLASLVQ
ncbi:alpha/beta fold hydrolase [Arthrobacter sp. zg-ZUI100]|uniref:alpha/beta fold hydrolase n=1 Tax=Arthrobacter jiangjiafuii TaxID=2817475 RepID=UPI001AEE5BEB|nr:alpha/beta fold hydrolase [Arthrobacter jiangjiafuii]MBP3036884.1 alpha/beta fold hydrolase [Arthrobacter jiangjiafuii]